MLSASDQEKISQSHQTAQLLINNLQALLEGSDALLADIILDLIPQAALIEQRLARLVSIAKKEEMAA
jgi:hypothetical protein